MTCDETKSHLDAPAPPGKKVLEAMSEHLAGCDQCARHFFDGFQRANHKQVDVLRIKESDPLEMFRKAVAEMAMNLRIPFVLQTVKLVGETDAAITLDHNLTDVILAKLAKELSEKLPCDPHKSSPSNAGSTGS